MIFCFCLAFSFRFAEKNMPLQRFLLAIVKKKCNIEEIRFAA